MEKKSDMMKKFDFLLGNWKLDYRVPKSAFSEAVTGWGKGTIKRALDDRYVYFDYSASFNNGTEGKAHAVFAWDEKTKVYRYWWFENSGSYLTATCNFLNSQTLFLNWHDTLLIQTFTKDGPKKVILRMQHPTAAGTYEAILEVVLTKK